MAAFLLFAFIIHTSVWWQKVCRMLLFWHFFLFTFVAQSSACKEKSYFLGCLNFSGVLLLLFTVHHSSYSVSYLTFCFASLVYGLIMSCWGFFGGKPCPQATAEGFMTSALVAAFTKKNQNDYLSEDPIWTGSFLHQINLAQGFVHHSRFSHWLEANDTLHTTQPLHIISSFAPAVTF